MANQKTIPTSTIATIKANQVSIDIFYDNHAATCCDEMDENCESFTTGYPNTLQALISDFNGFVDGVPVEAGDLVMSMKNYPVGINYQINSLGQLIVIGDDASGYSIDEMGYLIYDFCKNINLIRNSQTGGRHIKVADDILQELIIIKR